MTKPTTLLLLAFAAGPLLRAQTADPLDAALSGGKILFNARLRDEFGDASNLKDANALTLSTRFGFQTAPVDGLQALVEGGNTTVLGNENDYSAGGTNPGGTGRINFPDVPVTYLNQAWASYSGFDSVIKVGRQRFVLDNARFVGDVAWWDKTQTFDAAGITVKPAPGLSLVYDFVWHVSRIYGNEQPQPDWQSRSHFLNASYSGCSFGTLTAYGYLLDFKNSAANSSDTFGASFVGAAPVTKDFKFVYRAEAATQSEAANNPVSYTARYAHAQIGGVLEGFELDADYEVLGSDGGRKGFATPLATLHLWNGWVNEFLTTPAAGLRDFYVTGGIPLPGPTPLKIVYHTFKSDFGDLNYGHEWDALITHKIGKHWTLLAEAGRYVRGIPGAYFDTNKYWLQTEFTY